MSNMPVSERTSNALLLAAFAEEISLLSRSGAEIDDDEYGVEGGGEVNRPVNLLISIGRH
jgi:hypothetical protein